MRFPGRFSPKYYPSARTCDSGDDSLNLCAGGLLVQAFAADDSVQGVGPRDVIVLSTNASIELAPLLGKQAALAVRLADGTRTQFRWWGSISGLARIWVHAVDLRRGAGIFSG
jgi:uncharacterized protein involved in type VI secretion and phage assembly